MFRIRIRMDPGHFADPDPDFKIPDPDFKIPDPSINKLMGSKWYFGLGFGGTWPKRTVFRVQIWNNKNFYLYQYLLFLDVFFMDLDQDFLDRYIEHSPKRTPAFHIQHVFHIFPPSFFVDFTTSVLTTKHHSQAESRQHKKRPKRPQDFWGSEHCLAHS